MNRILRKFLKRHKDIASCASTEFTESCALSHVGHSNEKVVSSSSLKRNKISDNKVVSETELSHRLSNTRNTLLEKHNLTFGNKPIKSENDTKEYLVIKLQNGLTALLVSDTEKVNEPEEMVNSSSEIAKGILKSAFSKQKREDNIKQIEKLAACSLTVKAGSFEDPEEIPGLAHMLEHMLFMGSEKFSKENDFNSFLTTRGGSNNAMTDCEYTTYYFECPEQHLENTMDRFTNLFIAPLIKRDSLIRERESVESEYQMHSTNDGVRLLQIITSTAAPNNPARKFIFGNLKTLKDNVKEDDLERSLRNFWSTNYSANRMTVAVQARLPLNTLGNLVADYFGKIPTNSSRKDTLPNMDWSFKKKSFNKLYTMMPVSNVNMVRLTWVMPAIQNLYKSKPTLYTSFMINHEGKGSLMSYLKKNLWALNVVAESGSGGTSNNTYYSLFSIVILLTENGLSNIDKVLTAVFSYIKMLQTDTPSENIWKEIKLMRETNFRYSPEIQSSDYVQFLSQNMQIYEAEDYMTGSRLISDYKPAKIIELLNLLTPDKVNVILMSKKAANQVELDKTERWFKAKYNVSDIPDKWKAEWKNSTKVDSTFSLPPPNPFIPTNFSILPDDNVTSESPLKIRHDRYMELWFKQDKKFLLPYGYITIYLTSPYAILLPQNVVMCDLLVSLFSTIYDEEVYSASIAGLVHNLNTSDNGLILTIVGYNEKMPLFLETILDFIKSINKDLTAGIFETIKEEQRKLYYNEVLDPTALARELRLSVLCEPFFTSMTKLEAISMIDMKLLQEFTSNFLENLYVKCLIQGNISKEQTMEMASTLQRKLNYKPLLQEHCPTIRVRQLPKGEKIIRVKSFNDQDMNCHITNYYQFGLSKNVTETCIVELLMMTMSEPLYDTLRTKEQLGYFVHNDIQYTYGVIGFSLAVKFQSDKFNVEYVESRMSKFLKKMSADVGNMSEENFKQLKESMKLLKSHVDTHLGDEVERNWSEIESNEYIFDRLKREINFLETLGKQEMYNYLTQILESKKTHSGNIGLRKLSVQVDSNNLASSSSNLLLSNSSLNNITHNIEFIMPNKNKEKKNFIDDIKTFRNHLYIYPILKIKL